MTRVKAVEYRPGYGWIARSPKTGEECIKDFYWRTRNVARTVAAESMMPFRPWRGRKRKQRT